MLTRGLTILLKLLPVTPNDAEANTLTDLVFDDVMTEIEVARGKNWNIHLNPLKKLVVEIIAFLCTLASLETDS